MALVWDGSDRNSGVSMLQGLLFLAGVIAFCLVVIWVVSNDAPGIAGGSKGLLAMKEADDYARAGAGRGARWHRRRSDEDGEPSRRVRRVH